MNSAHSLALATPAANFYESFLLGNGSLGVALHGSPGSERMDLNLDTFWSGGPSGPDADAMKDPKQWLEPLRAAIRAEAWADAQEYATRLQGSRYSQSFQPLGTLAWNYAARNNVSNYERVLDLKAADARVEFTTSQGSFRLEAFVSAVRGVAVVHLDFPESAESTALPRFESPHEFTAVFHDAHEEGMQITSWAGRAPENVLPDYLGDVPNPVTYSSVEPDANGLVDAGMGFAVAGLVQRTGPSSVRLLLAAADGFQGRGARPSADLVELREKAVRAVRVASAETTDVLKAAHRADYQSYFDRVDLSLDHSPDAANAKHTATAEDVERFFHFGRYLLISSSRPGSQAANLQGIWNDDVRPGWSCNYTTNINVEMNYWMAEPLGLADLAQTLTDLVADLAEMATTTAKVFYGAPGWSVHHNADIWGFSTPVKGSDPTDVHHANWPVGGLWLAAHPVRALRYATPEELSDRDPRKMWDIVSGAVEFALFLLDAYPDGSLVTNPSTSPEHDFVVDGSSRSISSGTAMDQELVREVLTNFIRLVDAGAAPEGERARHLEKEARSALSMVRLPAIGSGGHLLEWAEEREPLDRGHRHLSHLYGVYPGDSIDEVETPVLFEAARHAMQDRIDHGSGYTGWSQTWILCLAARFRDSSLVQHSLDVLVHQLASTALLDLHPVPDHVTGYRFQIDGNLGAPAGIAECLVQSRDKEIRLLPAVPQSMSSGSLRGFRALGGHIVEVVWRDSRPTSVSIGFAREGAMSISVPMGREYIASLARRHGADSGDPVVFDVDGGVDGMTTCTIDVREGDRLTIATA